MIAGTAPSGTGGFGFSLNFGCSAALSAFGSEDVDPIGTFIDGSTGDGGIVGAVGADCALSVLVGTVDCGGSTLKRGGIVDAVVGADGGVAAEGAFSKRITGVLSAGFGAAPSAVGGAGVKRGFSLILRAAASSPVFAGKEAVPDSGAGRVGTGAPFAFAGAGAEFSALPVPEPTESDGRSRGFKRREGVDWGSSLIPPMKGYFPSSAKLKRR